MHDLPTHANFDPIVCLASGLFRSIKRGTRRRPLTIEWPKADQIKGASRAGTFMFRSDELLGADDLRVLQGVLAFANRMPRKIPPEAGGELGTLRARLKLDHDAKAADVLLITLGYAELARAVGYGTRNQRDLHGGGLSRKIETSLDRLAGLSVAWRHGGLKASWQFLAWDTLGTRNRKLRIVLNPRAGQCALGMPPFARIDLGIARKLTTDPARLMHQRLSAWIGRAKEPSEIGLERLAAYPWSPEEAESNCLRKRRWVVKNVIEELKAAGWQIDEIEGRSALRRISVGGLAAEGAEASNGHPTSGSTASRQRIASEASHDPTQVRKSKSVA